MSLEGAGSSLLIPSNSNTLAVAATRYVDSSEVAVNVVATNLMIFRLVDYQDSKKRLHNGYQILYTGDLKAATDGLLTATLVDDTTIVVSMPAVPNSVLSRWQEVNRAFEVKGYGTGSVKNSQTTGISKLANNPELQQVHIQIKFDKTGETITNEVFSPHSIPFGAIAPQVTPFQSTVQYGSDSKVYATTDLFVAFNVTRVELAVRMAEIRQPSDTNPIAAELQGMNVG